MELLILMQFIILEIGIPAISWYGVVLTAVMTLLGFLIRDAYVSLKKRLEMLEQTVEDLTQKLDAEKLNNEKAMRALDARINELHLNILNRLDDIKDKFNEFRK